MDELLNRLTSNSSELSVEAIPPSFSLGKAEINFLVVLILCFLGFVFVCLTAKIPVSTPVFSTESNK